MNKKSTMNCWKGERFRLEKALERPDIMTQGDTAEDLAEDLNGAFHLTVSDELPSGYSTIEIAL